MRDRSPDKAAGLDVRVIEPEWLDTLPSGDPRAVHSRRDLRRVNAWMANVRIMETHLTACCTTPPRSIVDLGGGDGTLLLELARRRSRQWPSVAAIVVDRQDVIEARTAAEFASLGWELRSVIADAVDYGVGNGSRHADVAVANLFLHHLDARRLARLFARLAEAAAVFVACEPRRSALSLAGSRMLWAIGCNDVSRHDAVASVRAGFRGNELSALWPESGEWHVEERRLMPFTHSFVARRQAAGRGE